MKAAVCFVVGLGLGLLMDGEMTNASERLPENWITGRNFLAVQAALPELQRRNLNVEDYLVVVSERGDSIFVLFTDPKAPLGIGQPTPNLQRFDVVLSKDDLKVISAHYSR